MTETSSQSKDQEARSRFKALEEVLRDSLKREEVEQVLQSFAGLDRSTLFYRLGCLARYLERICGGYCLNALFLVVTKALPDVDKFLSMVDDEGIRRWLADLNSKYISIYEGVFPPFPHDWYRTSWNVRMDMTHGNIPFMGFTLLKRNGEVTYLDMPFNSVIDLMKSQLLRMKQFQETQPSAPAALGLRSELEELRKLIDAILENSTQLGSETMTT